MAAPDRGRNFWRTYRFTTVGQAPSTLGTGNYNIAIEGSVA